MVLSIQLYIISIHEQLACPLRDEVVRLNILCVFLERFDKSSVWPLAPFEVEMPLDVLDVGIALLVVYQVFVISQLHHHGHYFRCRPCRDGWYIYRLASLIELLLWIFHT